MQLEIGKKYRRTAPIGDTTEVTITEQNKEYYESYIEKGFIYKDIYDFDLPSVPNSSPQVTVHKGPGSSVCIACEG